MIWLSVQAEIKRQIAIIAAPMMREPKMLPTITAHSGVAKKVRINLLDGCSGHILMKEIGAVIFMIFTIK